MRPVRILSMVLSAVLATSALLYAQTSPDITLPSGDAIRGKAIFESSKGNCQSCHRVNGTGSMFGPDLSAIGGSCKRRGAPMPAAPRPRRRHGPTPQQLAQSILDPNAVVSVQNRYVLLTMKDGKTISGKTSQRGHVLHSDFRFQ